MKVYEQVHRTLTITRTYVRKVRQMLYWDQAPDPLLPGYWTLLDEMLMTVEEIIEKLPDSFFATTRERSFLDGELYDFSLADEARERADKVVALLVARTSGVADAKLIAALENVEGRTPEEAEAYLAKAKQLRERRVIAS